MDHQHQQYFDRVSELVLAYLTPVLVQKLEGQVDLIQQAKNSLDEYYATIDQEENKVGVLELVRKMKTLKESLAQSVNGIAVIDKDIDLDKDYEQYFSELKKYAETLPESLLEYQSLDRFQPFTGDTFKIRVGKRLKKWGLKIGWVPRRIANWFRRKTNKAEKDLVPWKHHIPLQGMITYHFRDLLVDQLIDMVQAINRSIAASTHELYLTESSLDQKFASMIGNGEQDGLTYNTPDHRTDVDEILKKVTQLLETIPGMTANRLQRINGMFQINYEMVGTIELSVNNFEGSGLEAVHRQAKKAYRKTMDGWRNTLTVLSDRYNFDHELFKTRFTNLEQYLFVSNKLETRISEKIKDDISQIAEFLAARKRQLEVSTTEDADFKKSLVEIRFEISRFLKQSIPACIQLIREQNVPALLENLEVKTKNQVSQLSETLSMVKNISYEHAIKESDISKIAPKDLITFEALPEFLNKIRSLHSNFTDVIESTQQHLMEISNICDFNLETALAALEDESQHDRAKSMSIEGIERAHSRLQDIIEDLSKLAAIGDKTIHDGVLEFNDSIMSLNEIDEAFDTQVRIAKAKAVEKTKSISCPPC